jgi:phage repressor protein C with HTH and peptisase S24 domain
VSLADFEAGQARVQSEVRGTGMSAREVRDAWASSGKSPVPLLGSAFGGEWNDLEDVEMIELRLAEVLDYLARPPSLAEDPEAYAVEIVGDSMAPRYEPGERVFVSPKAAVRVGDDVIVQLRAPHEEGRRSPARSPRC